MKNKCRNTDSSIKAGDLILTEQPFAYVLSSKEKGFRCDNCLEKGKVLKCSGCQFVHYCGRMCQRDAWIDHKDETAAASVGEGSLREVLEPPPAATPGNEVAGVRLAVQDEGEDEMWECANLKRIAPKVIPDSARMLAKIINRLNRGDGHSYRAFYSATSFRMWRDLMSHYSDLKNDRKRMDHFSTLCVVLHEFLKDISLPNTVELMGIYGRMVINSFTLLDTDMNSIGTGIYLACSIVDHSCNPNAVATFDGKTINIRAIQDMPCLDWDHIRISYIDLMKTPYDRQTELLSNYYFLCQCDRCMDETQYKYLHAAKCLNTECDNPVVISWKENCQLIRKPEKTDETLIQNGDSITNGHDLNNGLEIKQDKQDDGTIHCDACGTKFTEKHVRAFVECMEFTEVHLQNMSDTSMTYVDVCKYCLEKQEGVLHPLNVMHAQTLDHAFDSLIQVQLWEQACIYAEKLLPCFKFYYGGRNPLLGLSHLKYGKILLYKMELPKALGQLKCAQKILKMTHGERHPLYRDQLLPLLTQAMLETS